MVFDLSQITGLGPYVAKPEKHRTLYFKQDKAFLVVNKNTIELRTDPLLADNLITKYESVMESRYFGKGGIEIVLADQLNQQELEDLIRLSYNMTQ